MTDEKMSSKSTKIYVGNIPEDCKVDQLSDLFAKYGRVQECDIVKNYGFVHMSSDEETKTAIRELNGYEFKGNKISVELSHSKVRPKPGMGGKGQCYRCGKSGHWSKECPRNSEERVRSLLRAKRYTPYGFSGINTMSRSRPPDRDRYERLQYYRDYIHPYERMPLPDPYDRRTPPEYIRRLMPPEPYDPFCERRIRERFDPYLEEHPYHEYYTSIRRTPY